MANERLSMPMSVSDFSVSESPQFSAEAGRSAPAATRAVPVPDFKVLFDALPALILVLDPGLYIVAATNTYLEARLTRRDEIVGCQLFDVFPDNPDNSDNSDNSDDPSAAAMRHMRASLQRVLQKRVADTMAVQRHELRRPASEGGGVEVRYWSPVNSPVLHSDGSLAYIIHRLENVSEFTQMTPQAVEPPAMTGALREPLLHSQVQKYLPKPFSVDEMPGRLGAWLAARHHHRRRLERSEERFRATFEQAAVGIAHVALDGRWLRVNRTLCEIVGYTRDELLARSFQDITHPADLDIDLGLVRQLLADQIPHYSLDKRYLNKSGTPVWVRLTVALVRDANAQPEYFIVVIEDIRARKEAEAEVLRLNVGLERRVEERTAELQAANRELDSFAYAVSHDLRAPLRAMRGFSEALAEDFGEQLPAGALTCVEQIWFASRQMGELIDGLLALSRSTLAELQQDEIDLSALASDILAGLARAEPRRQVAVSVERGLAVRGDLRMVDAMMRNLLGNAWKYTRDTTQPLIRVAKETQDGRDFICVIDNGAGFDMTQSGKLFKPFQRLHRPEQFPGTGIGLATVQRIVLRHSGTLQAQGEPGRGARFCFNLPYRGQS